MVKNIVKAMICLLTIAMPSPTKSMLKAIQKGAQSTSRFAKQIAPTLHQAASVSFGPKPTPQPEQKRLLAPAVRESYIEPAAPKQVISATQKPYLAPIAQRDVPFSSTTPPEFIQNKPLIESIPDDELSLLLETPSSALPARKIVPEIAQAAQELADAFNAIPIMDPDDQEPYYSGIEKYQSAFLDLVKNNTIKVIFIAPKVNLNELALSPLFSPTASNTSSPIQLNNGATIILLVAEKSPSIPFIITPPKQTGTSTREPEIDYKAFFHIPDINVRNIPINDNPLQNALIDLVQKAQQQKPFQLASISQALENIKNKIPAFQELINQAKSFNYDEKIIKQCEIYISQLESDIRLSKQEINTIEYDFEELKDDLDSLSQKQEADKRAIEQADELIKQKAEQANIAAQELLRQAQEKAAIEEQEKEQIAPTENLAQKEKEEIENAQKLLLAPPTTIVEYKEIPIEQPKQKELDIPQTTAIVPKIAQEGSSIAQAAEHIAHTFNLLYDNISANNYEALLEQYQNTLGNLVENNNVLVTLIAPPAASILPKELTPSASQPLISNDHFAITRLRNNFIVALINAPQPSPLVLVSSPERVSQDSLALTLPNTIDVQTFDQSNAFQFIAEQLKPSLMEKPFQYSAPQGALALVMPSQAMESSSPSSLEIPDIALATKKLAEAFNQSQTSTMSSAAFFQQRYEDALTNLVQNNNVIVGFIAPEVTTIPAISNVPSELIIPSQSSLASTELINTDGNYAATKLVNGFTLVLINAPQPSPVFILTPPMATQDYKAILNIPNTIEALSIMNTPNVKTQLVDKMLSRAQTIKPFQLYPPTQEKIVQATTSPQQLMQKTPEIPTIKKPAKLKISYETTAARTPEFGLIALPQEPEYPFEIFKQLPQPPVPFISETKQPEVEKIVPRELPTDQAPAVKQYADLTVAQAAKKLADAFNLVPEAAQADAPELYDVLLNSYHNTLTEVMMHHNFRIFFIDSNVDLSSSTLKQLDLEGPAQTNYSSRIKLNNNATLVLLVAEKPNEGSFIITPPKETGFVEKVSTFQPKADYKKYFHIPENIKDRINIVPVNNTSLIKYLTEMVNTAIKFAPAPIIPKITQQAQELAAAFNAIPIAISIDEEGNIKEDDPHNDLLKKYQEKLTQLLKENNIRIIFVAPEVDLKSPKLAALKLQDETQTDYSATIKLDNGATMIFLTSEEASRQPYIITPPAGFLAAKQAETDYRKFFHIPNTINAHITPANDNEIQDDLAKMEQTAQDPVKAMEEKTKIIQKRKEAAQAAEATQAAKELAQKAAQQAAQKSQSAAAAAQKTPAQQAPKESWFDFFSNLIPKQPATQEQPPVFEVPATPQPPMPIPTFEQPEAIPTLEFPEPMQPPVFEFPEAPSLEQPEEAQSPGTDSPEPEQADEGAERIEREPRQRSAKTIEADTQAVRQKEKPIAQPRSSAAFGGSVSEPISAKTPQWHTAPTESPKQPFRPTIPTGTYTPYEPSISQPFSGGYAAGTSSYFEQPSSTQDYFAPMPVTPAPAKAENWAAGILSRMRQKPQAQEVLEQLPEKEPMVEAEIPEMALESDEPKEERKSLYITRLAKGLMKEAQEKSAQKKKKAKKEAAQEKKQQEAAAPVWEQFKTAVADAVNNTINYFKKWFSL